MLSIENIKSSSEYFEICKLLLSAIRDIITVKEDALCRLSYFTDIEKAEEYAQMYSSFTLISMCDIIFGILQNETAVEICQRGTREKKFEVKRL